MKPSAFGPHGYCARGVVEALQTEKQALDVRNAWQQDKKRGSVNGCQCPEHEDNLPVSGMDRSSAGLFARLKDANFICMNSQGL